MAWCTRGHDDIVERHKEKGDEFLNFAGFYDMVAAKASKECIFIYNAQLFNCFVSLRTDNRSVRIDIFL